MHILSLTISNIEIPNRITVHLYNSDKVTVEEMIEDIQDTLGDNYKVTGSIIKYLNKCIQVSRKRKFEDFYTLTTKSSIRFAVRSKEID